MHHEMHSGTDAATHALFDPSLTPPLEHEDKTIELAERDGRVLLIATGGDGELGYRIYVDAPIPDELLARAKPVASDLLLRAPSGQLVACGLENVAFRRESEASVGPGNYLVDAWETDFD